MTQKRKRYDKQFKIAAARVVLGGEMRAVDLAREKAKQDVFKYIELYYNARRVHSSIGYNAPCDLERDAA